MRNEKGFTLIELVVVIVILGILAAVAVPKFVDMQIDARKSSLKGLLGTVKSASSLAHAQALVQGQTGATGSVTMEGSAVALDFGYPDLDGIAAAVNIDGFTYVAATGIFTLTGGTNCTVTYEAAEDATTPPVITDTVATCQ
jgi:MSHA pilin protein MshA